MENHKCEQHQCKTERELRLYDSRLVYVEKVICIHCGSTREAIYRLLAIDNIIDKRTTPDSGRLRILEEDV